MKKEFTFLLDLYQCSFPRQLFNLTPNWETSARVKKMVAQYEETVKAYPPLAMEKLKSMPLQLLDQFKKMGLFGLSIAEQYGGLGYSLTEYLQVVEAMARYDLSLALIPLAHLSIGLKGIVLFGTEKQKTAYLPRAASGELVFAYALTEPKIGSDAQHITTSALLSADKTHYLLNGTKTFITNGNYAGALTVFAQLDPQKPGFMGAFIVETDWPGVTVGKDMDKMGLAVSSTTPIQFKDVKVPVQNLIGNPGDGFKIAMSILNYGRLGLGAASTGLMKKSLADMKKRSSTRIQFGTPIDSFQLIQEKQVQARVYSYMTNAMTLFTARMLEENPLQNVAAESSHCKLYGTQSAWQILYEALQTAGGAGYLKSNPYEKRMRDFRVATVFEGTTEIHSIYPPLIIARTLYTFFKQASSGQKLKFFLASLWGQSLSTGYKKFDPVLKQALKEGGFLLTLIRRKMIKGMKKYKKAIINQEYFLRRVTRLSVHLYGLLSILAYFIPGQKQPSSEEKQIITYLIKESRCLRKNGFHPAACSLDQLKHELFVNLKNETTD